MNITGLTSVSFKGRVSYDKERTAKQIAKLKENNPQWQIDSLIGNINTLKQNLETQTPDDSTFAMDLFVKTKEAKIPTGASAEEIEFGMPDIAYKKYASSFKINLIDTNKNKEYNSQGELGIYDTYKDGFESLTTKKEMEQNTFKKITENAIKNANTNKKAPTGNMDKETAAIFDQLV